MLEQQHTFVAVSGSMRSGTSLLGHLLQVGEQGRRAHPDLAFENDTSRLIVDFFEAVRKGRTPHLTYGDPFEQVRLEKSMLEEYYQRDFADTHEAFDLARQGLVGEILDLAPPGPPPKFVGIKRTSMNYELDVVRDLFPSLKAIFTVRDPRDIFISHATRVGTEQTSGYSLLIVAYIVAGYYRTKGLPKLLNGSVGSDTDTVVVKYEDFIKDAHAGMSNVLDFVGISSSDYAWTALSGADVPSNSSFNEAKGGAFVAGAGITTESVGRFASLIDPDVCTFIELLCAPLMQEHGYLPTNGKGAWTKKLDELAEALRVVCVPNKVSFAPVAARMRELGVTDQ